MTEPRATPMHTPFGDALLLRRRTHAAPDLDGLCAAWQKRLGPCLASMLPTVTFGVATGAASRANGSTDDCDVAEFRLGADETIRIILSRQTFLGLIAIAMGGDDSASTGRQDRVPSELEFAIVAHLLARMMSPMRDLLAEAGWTGQMTSAAWIKPSSTHGEPKAETNVTVECRLRSWKGEITITVPTEAVRLLTRAAQTTDGMTRPRPPMAIPRFAAETITRLDVHLSSEPMCFGDVLSLRVGDTLALKDPSARRVLLSCADHHLFAATLARQGRALVAHIDAPIAGSSVSLRPRTDRS